MFTLGRGMLIEFLTLLSLHWEQINREKFNQQLKKISIKSKIWFSKMISHRRNHFRHQTSKPPPTQHISLYDASRCERASTMENFRAKQKIIAPKMKRSIEIRFHLKSHFNLHKLRLRWRSERKVFNFRDGWNLIILSEFSPSAFAPSVAA